MVKILFAGKIIPAVPLAGRLKHFVNSWKMLTMDEGHLSVVGCKKTLLQETASEANTRKYPHESSTGNVVDMEIPKILTKGAIPVVQKDEKKGFLSSLFIVGKRDEGYRLVINLKELNKHIPYQQKVYQWKVYTI